MFFNKLNKIVMCKQNMFSIHCIILSIVICQIYSISLTKKITLTSSLKQNTFSSGIKVSANSILSAVRLNENNFDINNFKYSTVPSVYDSLSYNFVEGNEVHLSAIANSEEDKHFIISEIYYKGKDGSNLVLPTDEKWICNDKPAHVYSSYDPNYFNIFSSTDENDGFEYGKYIWSSNLMDKNVHCHVILGPKQEFLPDTQVNPEENNPENSGDNNVIAENEC